MMQLKLALVAAVLMTLVLSAPRAIAVDSTAEDPAAVESPGGEPVSLNLQPFFFALSVADVEASEAWYRRVLGFESVRRIGAEGDAFRIHLLRRDGAFVELVQSGAARSFEAQVPTLKKRHQVHGVFKVGFLVASLDDALARLERLEVPLRGKVITEADGSLRSLQVEDPDGNVIQIFEILVAQGESRHERAKDRGAEKEGR
ncbi:MAG: VOC family protein [Deltaproteobacteria bacterium]|nr:VOC family protein [Deltaproteobacteria bacterium]